MVRFKLLLPLLLSGFSIWLLSTHQPFGAPFPPLGPLISPFSGFWQQAEPENPVGDREWTLEGLGGSVQVVFDDRLVPHIYAETLEDAAFAQGYVTAAFRLWQMDVTARSTSGRLSEVLGSGLLERDRRQRRLGLARAARNALAAWEKKPDEIALVDAYARGVNALIQKLSYPQYPLEFKLLAYEPEPWSAYHSALVFKSMAQTLCMRHNDVQASNARAVLGETLFADLYPEYNPAQSPVIPESVQWAFDPLPVEAPKVEGEDQLTYRHELLPQPPAFIGSNNWALAGSRTASGAPLLANDPHLSLTLPSIWYELHIHTPDYQVYGVSLPGLPGLVIGFNKDVAWGMTNVGQDVLDWYRIQWADPEKTSYLLDGETVPVEILLDTIRVRGQRQLVVDTLKYTEWGPIVYADPADNHQDLAMHWLAADDPENRQFFELGAFFRLGKASNYEAYASALRGYSSPAQNFIFASREGDIALKVNGRFPLKRPGQGRFVQDGSRSENAWQGFIPMDHIPQVRNPERGFVASANQRSTNGTYPYYYNGNFDDYRGRYINRQLEQAEGWTAREMMALQNDARSLFPLDALPVFRSLLDRTALPEHLLPALDSLTAWDGRFRAGSGVPVLFDQWYRELYRAAFDEIYAANEQRPMLFPEKWRLLEMLQRTPGHRIFDRQDTEAVEGAADLVRESFLSVMEEQGEAFRAGALDWSDYNGLQIRHLGQIPAFSTGTVRTSGYGDAPNAIKPTTGPSWRMVVELGDTVRAWGVFPGGPSGNPGSHWYDRDVETWRRGDYHLLTGPVPKEQVRGPAVWTFSPAGK